MTIAKMQFHSPNMNKQINYNAILPDVGDGPFPAVIMLHGLTDNHEAWLQNSMIAKWVQDYPMAVLMPDGGTSMYLNWRGLDRVGRQRYEAMIMEDLIAHARRTFHLTEGKWAIGGLSMGGFGSMRLGLKYAEQFASIWSHSSKFYWEDIPGVDLLEDLADADIEPHAKRVSTLSDKPVISFDCGTEDGLLVENRRFHAYLEKLGVEHTYKEHSGGHTWPYWNDHVQEALAQHAQVFGITPVSDQD